MSFRDIFSIWCISLSFMFTIPQAFRVIHRNTVVGISVSSQMQSLSGSILWVVYGLAAHSYLVVLANVMTICGFGLVVIKQIQLRVIALKRALLIEAGVLVIALVALQVSRDLLGILAVVVGGTGIVPQVVRAARTNHLVGVSVVTFAMVVTMSVSWGFYGLMIDDLFVALPNVVIAPSALYIMFRAIQSHRRYGKISDAVTVPAR